jgi:hypothetical protein
MKKSKCALSHLASRQKLRKRRIDELISPRVWRDDCTDFQERNRMVYLGTAKPVPLKPIR